MIRPGPRNLITDIAGIAVGNAEDRRAWSGVTVVLPAARVVAAVDVRGGGPGTRETDLLDPVGLVEAVDAVVLAGGSAFGLEAAAGATAWLAGRGRGFRLGAAVVPIVPAAILFDLLNGGDKGWGEVPPYRALGLEACEAAGALFRLGNAGAGLGAKAGRLKGGLGSVSAVDEAEGLAVGALVAANPLGSVVMPGEDGCFWAWALELADELGGRAPPRARPAPELDLPVPGAAQPGGNTTLAVVATDADLTRVEARRLAIMAQDGIARAIRPAHTPFDGDVVFALATGARPLPAPRPAALARLGALAADAVARAVMRGVFLAEDLGAWPAHRRLYGA